MTIRMEDQNPLQRRLFSQVEGYPRRGMVSCPLREAKRKADEHCKDEVIYWPQMEMLRHVRGHSLDYREIVQLGRLAV